MEFSLWHLIPVMLQTQGVVFYRARSPDMLTRWNAVVWGIVKCEVDLFVMNKHVHTWSYTLMTLLLTLWYQKHVEWCHQEMAGACCLTCRVCCLCVIMSGCLQPSAVIFLALFSSSFTSWGTCFCVPLGVPCLSSGCRMQITDSHCYLTCWRRFPCNTHSTYSTSVNLLWDVLNRETICLNDSDVWNSLSLYLHKSCFLLCTFYVTFIQPRLNDVDC